MNNCLDIHVQTSHPEELFRSVAPETESAPSRRSNVKLETGEGELRLLIEAEDPSALRAAMNSWLRWIQVSKEVLEATAID